MYTYIYTSTLWVRHFQDVAMTMRHGKCNQCCQGTLYAVAMVMVTALLLMINCNGKGLFMATTVAMARHISSSWPQVCSGIPNHCRCHCHCYHFQLYDADARSYQLRLSQQLLLQVALLLFSYCQYHWYCQCPCHCRRHGYCPCHSFGW